MSFAPATHTGVFEAFRYRKDNGFTLGVLGDGTTIVGRSGDGDLVPGLTYLFHGRWDEHPQYGRQFKFRDFVQQRPHGREGVVAYLVKHAPGIGAYLAGALYDHFGTDAVKMLRTDPEACSKLPKLGRHLTLDRCRRASEALQEAGKYEDTTIDLVNLFHGRGFPGALVRECIQRWGVHAPEIIRRDPFRMLVLGMSGCGFARCDRLYKDLGLPLDRLKRQVICLWHAIKEDLSGDTWLPLDRVEAMFQGKISGVELNGQEGLGPDLSRALKLGVRAGWLAVRTEEGQGWVAIGERARQEAELAGWIKGLSTTATSSIPMPPNGCGDCPEAEASHLATSIPGA